VTFHCLLRVLVLCAALHDKPSVILTLAHAGATSWDWTVTRENIVRPGLGEADPLARPFVHANATTVVAAVAEVVLCAYVAHRTRGSRHRILHDTWWMWQAVPTVAHVLPQTGVIGWYQTR